MNDWQVLKQLEYKLGLLAWPDGSGEKVLSLATSSIVPAEEVVAELRRPFIMLSPGSDDADTHHPELAKTRIRATLVLALLGDRWGRAPLVGANRGDATSYGQGSSKGRGLLEVQEEVLGALQAMYNVDGMHIHARARGVADAILVEGLGHVVARDYTIEALCTTERYYHPPQCLTRAGGTVSWTLPPDRYDRYKIILRRAGSTTPPATPTAGTNVALASDLATSVADGTGAPVSWSVWCAYDETDDTPSEPQRYSSASTSIPGTTHAEA